MPALATVDGKPERAGAPTGFSKEQLRNLVARIENIEAEKKVLSDDIRDIFSEAKSSGYDVAALRTVIRLRKLDAAEREEQASILDVYLVALGMTPLEQAIADRS